MLVGADWCWLILIDTDWYWLMLIGADWFCLMPIGADASLCWLMLIDRDIGEVSEPAGFPQDDHRPLPPQDQEKWVFLEFFGNACWSVQPSNCFILFNGSIKLSCRVSPISATAVAAASFKKRSGGKSSKEERDKGKGSNRVAGEGNPSAGKILFDKIKLHCAPDSSTNLTAQRTLFRQYFLSCYDFGSFQSIWFCSEDFSDLVEEDAGGLLDRPSSPPTRWQSLLSFLVFT